VDFVNFAISYTISYWKNKSLFVYFFLIAFGFQLDFYFLSVFSSEEQLASYNAAYRIYMIMVSLVVIFQNFILGKVLSGERESFRKIKFYVYFEFILNAKFYSASGVLAILSLSCILSAIYAAISTLVSYFVLNFSVARLKYD